MPPQKFVVVGAGPVGALAALYAARRGDQVDIYELRGDLRDESVVPLNFTRSINLALSERGINAMRLSGVDGLVEDVMTDTIPMKGRMIHGKAKSGELEEKSQKYDVHGQAIHAVDRAELNKKLLDALESLPNVSFHFYHKLTGADLKQNKAWFEVMNSQTTVADGDRRAPEIEVSFDLIVGADGAHSATRFHLMKYARVNYQQEYIDTLWCEFHIPPNPSGSFALHPYRLHIWPGSRHMFIAIPSHDRSFTCTLFAPSETFTYLEASPSSLPAFFEANFPGVSPEHIAPKTLVEQFTSNPHLPLISIKCSPYHFGSSAVIVGDAAHAMVPFYGQGMNAGLEDVAILFQHLDAQMLYSPSLPASARPERRKRALAAYTQHRVPDAQAINDLALTNYWEMRSGVTSPVYLVRKYVEEMLSLRAPGLGWATQYSRVSFTNERYGQVIQVVRRQGQILLGVFVGLAFVLLSGPVGWWWKRGGWERLARVGGSLRELVRW